ncbi:MAG: PAS domain S-box protein, partial [Veillonellaceae bacterium]|nr:PAS domain S-box protein [Veillonellaceae bacterium]
INNGADFYIQKGGDPRSQFAELAHKIRQSVRRKKAELERIRSEEKFSKLFVAKPSLEAITDMATGKLLDVNDAFVRITGYSREEVIGRSTREINLFTDYTDREEMAKILRDDGVVQNAEIRIRTKSGEIRTLDFFGQCIRVGEKNLLFSQAIDITERKIAEAELRKSEERYRSIVNEQANLICRFSPDGTVTFTNEAYRRYFRPVLGLDTIEGQNVFAIIREAGYHDGEQLIGSLTSERSVLEIERKIIGKDGRIYWQRLSIHPILDTDGKPAEFQVVGIDITAQKLAEEEIRLKNAILLTQQETSPDGILVVGGNGKILNYNQRFVSIWAIPDELLTSDNDKPLLEYVTKQIADPDEYLSRVRYLYSHPDEKSFEEIVLRDGRILERYSLPMLGEGGEYYGRIWYFRDITGRKKTDEALFSSQQMLQAVLDNIPQRVFWKDRNLTFLGCNRPLARDVGFQNPSDIVGKTDYDHSSRDLAERFRSDDRKVMESGVPRINYEESQIRPDGSRAWLRTSKIPLRNQEGEIIGVLGTYEDITDEKRAEQALLESEEKFRRLAEKAPDLIYRMSLPEGKYEYVSPASEALTGYAPKDFYADPTLITRLIHPGWQEYLRQQFTALLEGNVPSTYEYRIIDRAGRNRWVNQRNVLVRDGSGNPVAIEGIVTDITA